MKKTLMAMVLAVASLGAWAGDFEDGVAAHEAGNYQAAAASFMRSAQQGDARAQYNLGVMYANGEGVRQDDAEAVRWWRLAAAQGNASAQYSLGVMYDNGRGVRQDDAEAVRWYRLAAEQGDAGAQLNLGVMYANGEGVRQDYVRAHMWFNLAAANGDENGFKNRDAAARRMTPQQIAQAQRMAAQCEARKYKGC